MALAVPEQPEFHFDALAELIDLAAGRPAWQRQAACRGLGPADFFPTRGPGGAEALERARHVCATCPVREQCEDFGAGSAGVWGGMTQRARQRRRRPPPVEPSRRRDVLAPVEQPTAPASPAPRSRNWGSCHVDGALGRGPEGAVVDPDAVTLEEWRASPAGAHHHRPADLTAAVEAIIASLARNRTNRP